MRKKQALANGRSFEEDDAGSGVGGAAAATAAAVMRVMARRPVDSIGIALMVGATATILVNALFLQTGRHPAPIMAEVLPVAMVAPAPAHDAVTPTSVPTTTISTPRARPADLAPAAAPETVARTRVQLITDIQRELARKGFYEGNLDGLYGPKMDAAIREFEQVAGLKQTGEPSEALLAAITRSRAEKAGRSTGSIGALLASSPPVMPPTPPAAIPRQPAATPAQASTRVAAIQRALTDFGYGQARPTGVYDAATKAMIEKFERDRKLPVTGQISDRLARELSAVTGRPLE